MASFIAIIMLLSALSGALGQGTFTANCPLGKTDAMASSGITMPNSREGNSPQTYIRAFYSNNNQGYVGRVWATGRLYSNEQYPIAQVYSGLNNAYQVPDAAMQDMGTNTEIHFSGSNYYRYALSQGSGSLNMQLVPGHPRAISTLPGMPSKVDAAMQIHPQMFFLINDATKNGYYYSEYMSLKTTYQNNNPVSMVRLLQEPNIQTIQAAVNYQGNLWVLYQTTAGVKWMAKLAYSPHYALTLLSKVTPVTIQNGAVGVMTCVD